MRFSVLNRSDSCLSGRLKQFFENGERETMIEEISNLRDQVRPLRILNECVL